MGCGEGRGETEGKGAGGKEKVGRKGLNSEGIKKKRKKELIKLIGMDYKSNVPMLAFLRAGASFTPSPVTATTSPAL